MVMGDAEDEHTFLCGYQRTRGYGSLANPHASTRAYQTIIRHQVEPTDTLQGLVLKYNTSMSEIKRLNRLWSNESLHLKESIDIPIYDVRWQNASSRPFRGDWSGGESTEKGSAESVQDIFRRIDTNIRNTTTIVHKLSKNSA
ncbi:unnamed protein product [Gongylonema pulchrum]|uniref:LysM domain-containing protein n=1 Tax=Gongylonema pulchrum TaxID=637853 RepID=A0A183DSH5_9BILA|nr:unnamed protein product [Gongylonema pulchrum]